MAERVYCHKCCFWGCLGTRAARIITNIIPWVPYDDNAIKEPKILLKLFQAPPFGHSGLDWLGSSKALDATEDLLQPSGDVGLGGGGRGEETLY